MTTGLRATFVISWSQTEVDGLIAPPTAILTVGASWRWTGAAVRVDGPQSLLVLEGAQEMADLRKHAARMVRRLIGDAIGVPALVPEPTADAEEAGFTVTDGRREWALTVIEVPDTGARLLVSPGEMPPTGLDLWVVRRLLPEPRRDARAASAEGVICFTPGTLIRTLRGERPIEGLRPGDNILTQDNGPRPVIWAANRQLRGARLHAMPHLRPIRFRTGALGIGRPDRDLIVSPQHRMLVRGAAARELFNADEVLVAAEDLVNGAAVAVDHLMREVTYVHILLERHQVIWANGLETESFHPSNTALDRLDPDALAGLMGILPSLRDDPLAYGAYARRNLSRTEAAILRHNRAA